MFAQFLGKRRNLPVSSYTSCGDDPYWSGVVLMMHMDGTNNLQTFIDETGKTVTTYGDARVRTDNKKFGGSAAYFDGTGDYLTLSDASLALGVSDFTVEMWFYQTAKTHNHNTLFSTSTATGSWAGGFGICLSHSGINNNLRMVDSTGNYLFTGSTVISTDTWHHLAVTRKSGVTFAYLDGVLEISAADTNNYSGYANVRIGCDIAGNEAWEGYIDEMRITKGTARYDSNPTALLMHFDSVIGGEGVNFGDSTGKAVTVVGNPAISNTKSKFGGYSGYFDGNGDYISIPWSNDFAFGTGDFTVECWVNTTSANTIMIVDNWYGNSWQCFMSAGKINFYYNGYVSGSTLINDGQWHHLAWVRKSGVMSGFVDGIEEFKTPFTYNAVSAAFPVYIGAQNAASLWFEGYIDELRITRGKALYSGSGDVLLLHFDGMVSPADFTDTTGKALTAVGNPTYNAQHKVGTSSVYFDGTGASLYTDSPVLDFGTGDYTVECWVLFSSTNAECVIGANSASQYADSFMILKEDVLRVYHGGAALLTVSCPNDGLWHHIAAVRASSMVYLYIDGVSQGNISGAQNLGQYRCTIGNAPAWSTTYAMHGYIDELRVSKGIARYNGTFTPSVTPFVADAYTTLLHHFNGVIGSGGAAFLPEETGKAVTLAGNTAISATQSKFGGYSGYFPAASSLTVAAQSDLFLANTDFTIEFWLFVEDNIPNYWCGVILLAGSGVATLQIEIEKAAKRLWSSYGNSYGTAVVVGTGWKHIAIVNSVSGNTFKIYVDGVLDVNVASYFQSAGSAPCYVTLGTPAANEDGNRYIDELRITKGIARYTANFTPPASAFTLSAYSAKDLSGNALPPTAPFTYEGSAVGVSNPIPPTEAFPSCRTDVAIAKTILEITFEDGFVDTSINPKTITASGGSSIVTFNGRKCGYFPGANDSLSINHADFNFTDSAVDFTIECWMYWKGLADSTIFYIGATNFVLIQARTTGDGIIDSYYPNWTRGFYSENSMLQALSNKWLHFALVRHNSSMKLYLDGVEYTALAHVTAFPANTTGTTMSFGGAEAYFDNYRVIKGYAKYLANFTPA
jgi:hypothetical protein